MDVDHDTGPLDRPPAGRWEALAGRVRPWIDWFGLGRIVGTAVTVLARGRRRLVAAAVARPADRGGPADRHRAGRRRRPPRRRRHHQRRRRRPARRPRRRRRRPAGRVRAARRGAGPCRPRRRRRGAAPRRRLVRSTWPRRSATASGSTFPSSVSPFPPPLPAAGAATSAAPTGPVDLNRATAAELDALPGIGPATAAGDRRPPRGERAVRLRRRPRGGPRHRSGQAGSDPTARRHVRTLA